MYSCKFVSDNGKTFEFDYSKGVIFDVNIGDGLSVNIGTSQGFSQIGETVENQTVGSRDLTVEGKITAENTSSIKNSLRKIFTPFQYGYFYFNNAYKIRCYVADTPTFSPVKNKTDFSLRLFCPYPYFSTLEEKNEELGVEIMPMFRFPTRLNSFRFGTSQRLAYKSVNNNGDVSIPYELIIIASVQVNEITVTNIETLEFIKLNGTVKAGEQVRIYRDGDNVLQIELTNADGETSDIISYLDDDSTLFELKPGTNWLSVTDNTGGTGLKVQILYSEAVVNLYEA